MSAKRVDIATMLDELNLPLAAARWSELWDAPEIVDYTPGQLFREVLEPQYLETMNNRYKTNLRLSRLIDKGALTENLVTGSKRRYNDAVVQQLLSFRFAEERLNVGVYGITVCAIRMGQVPERQGKLLRRAGWDSAALDNRLHCSYRETVK